MFKTLIGDAEVKQLWIWNTGDITDFYANKIGSYLPADAAIDFVIQYLYSEHNICSPDDDAAPYTPEELKEMATKILNSRR